MPFRLHFSNSLIPFKELEYLRNRDEQWKEGLTNVFLALRKARCFSALHTDMCWYLSRELFLTVCVIICYQVYKVFFADSRSLDGISRHRSVNFLVFVIFFVIIFNLSERLLPDCTLLTLLLAYVFVS